MASRSCYHQPASQPASLQVIANCSGPQVGLTCSFTGTIAGPRPIPLPWTNLRIFQGSSRAIPRVFQEPTGDPQWLFRRYSRDLPGIPAGILYRYPETRRTFRYPLAMLQGSCRGILQGSSGGPSRDPADTHALPKMPPRCTWYRSALEAAAAPDGTGATKRSGKQRPCPWSGAEGSGAKGERIGGGEGRRGGKWGRHNRNGRFVLARTTPKLNPIRVT